MYSLNKSIHSDINLEPALDLNVTLYFADNYLQHANQLVTNGMVAMKVMDSSITGTALVDVAIAIIMLQTSLKYMQIRMTLFCICLSVYRRASPLVSEKVHFV